MTNTIVYYIIKVNFINIIFIYENKTAWRLRAVALIPSKQGQGLGTKLFNFMLNDLEEKKLLKTIFCYSRVNSKNFYKKFGFKEKGEIFYYKNKLEVIIMIKEV